MNKLKKSIALLISICLLVSLVGCKNQNDKFFEKMDAMNAVSEGEFSISSNIDIKLDDEQIETFKDSGIQINQDNSISVILKAVGNININTNYCDFDLFLTVGKDNEIKLTHITLKDSKVYVDVNMLISSLISWDLIEDLFTTQSSNETYNVIVEQLKNIIKDDGIVYIDMKALPMEVLLTIKNSNIYTEINKFFKEYVNSSKEKLIIDNKNSYTLSLSGEDIISLTNGVVDFLYKNPEKIYDMLHSLMEGDNVYVSEVINYYFSDTFYLDMIPEVDDPTSADYLSLFELNKDDIQMSILSSLDDYKLLLEEMDSVPENVDITLSQIGKTYNMVSSTKNQNTSVKIEYSLENKKITENIPTGIDFETFISKISESYDSFSSNLDVGYIGNENEDDLSEQDNISKNISDEDWTYKSDISIEDIQNIDSKNIIQKYIDIFENDKTFDNYSIDSGYGSYYLSLSSDTKELVIEVDTSINKDTYFGIEYNVNYENDKDDIKDIFKNIVLDYKKYFNVEINSEELDEFVNGHVDDDYGTYWGKIYDENGDFSLTWHKYAVSPSVGIGYYTY